jgi:myo-inositol-1(or 4)-monophosphatase
VAEGIYDAFWEVGLQPWDLAAGSLLVEEAGGSVRNYAPAGRPYSIEAPGVIAGSTPSVRSIASLIGLS